jgi:TATA-box binding protein (TBP) (component of TFIID and TFIIIB)
MTTEILKKFEEHKEKMLKSMPKASKLQISTISMKAQLKSATKDRNIVLEDIVDKIWDNKKEPLTGFKYGNKLWNYKEGKSFNNCCNLKIGTVNFKIFSKGNITISGLKSMEHGELIVKQLYKYLNTILDFEISIDNLEITMINSGFNCNFHIKRKELYDALKDKYSVLYETTKYPAVKINFMYNELNQDKDTIGKCMCKDTIGCIKKKKNCSGKGEKDCKKIMIAVFQTGKIIISGSSDFKQLELAYEWINKKLTENYKNILSVSIDDILET